MIRFDIELAPASTGSWGTLESSDGTLIQNPDGLSGFRYRANPDGWTHKTSRGHCGVRMGWEHWNGGQFWNPGRMMSTNISELYVALYQLSLLSF
jgi:hypothetical protein